MEFQVPGNLMVLIGSFLVTTILMSTGCQASQKDEILNRHNYWRGKVDPAAANMQRMVWDDKLEALAAKWAKKCIFDHPTTEEEWKDLGQNLYISSASTLSIATAVDKWDSEKKDYDYAKDSCAPKKMCGHYTQVVWATSVKLGCSIQECDKMTETKLTGKLWNVVCQYQPQGNYGGAKPYVSGKACSKCPASMKYCVNNQCSDTASGGSSNGTSPGNGNSAISHDPRAVFIFIVATLLFTHAF